MTVRQFYVFVPGHPAPQGSKRHVGNGVMVESSKRVAGWRKAIVECCLLSKMRPRTPFNGAVVAQLQFIMPRPKSTPKFKEPQAIRRPDIDKLQRAVFDALTDARILKDDSQITDVAARKLIATLGEQPGCNIYLREDDGSIRQAHDSVAFVRVNSDDEIAA